ncbi:unnamed protein product [Hydatigera taeniaeformis]|uniref:Fibronectin type-III domain-containing protein n=1 Tax=Hydatigena taeniaeformis TaxID=6205 RepID=A0A0R3WXQ6_HYDTA|nr:unnamed protein product [Hydatigera taeniaeformis]
MVKPNETRVAEVVKAEDDSTKGNKFLKNSRYELEVHIHNQDIGTHTKPPESLILYSDTTSLSAIAEDRFFAEQESLKTSSPIQEDLQTNINPAKNKVLKVFETSTTEFTKTDIAYTDTSAATVPELVITEPPTEVYTKPHLVANAEYYDLVKPNPETPRKRPHEYWWGWYVNFLIHFSVF